MGELEDHVMPAQHLLDLDQRARGLLRVARLASRQRTGLAVIGLGLRVGHGLDKGIGARRAWPGATRQTAIVGLSHGATATAPGE